MKNIRFDIATYILVAVALFVGVMSLSAFNRAETPPPELTPTVTATATAAPVVVAEPGEPPVTPPAGTAPDYAGFVASVALIAAASAFAKERLGLTGNNILYAALGIVAVVAFYPDVIGLLPVGLSTVIDKFVYGVLLPFVSATGGYDLVKGFITSLPKPKPPTVVVNAPDTATKYSGDPRTPLKP